jgi:hypothetical protein
MKRLLPNGAELSGRILVRRSVQAHAIRSIQTHFVSFLRLALNPYLTNDGVSWTSVGAATRQGLTHSAAALDELDIVRVSG